MTDVSGAAAVDVLIITAVKEEHDAALLVETGAWPGSTWARETGPTGLEVAFRTFRAKDGSPMRVALTRALEMGGVATASAAGPLIERYKPKCLAMCGVCAGRRGEVELGDVIVADRLWTYDTGKLTVEIDEQGNRRERVQGDMWQYLIDPVWQQQAEGFVPDEAKGWLAKRPRAYEAQQDWLLDRLVKGEEPYDNPDREVYCADYAKVIKQLWKKEFLQDGTLTLTDAGRTHIQRRRILHPGGLPEPAAFKVHVGPIGTGSKVVQDPQIFERLSEQMRKVLGLEMEASAIGAIGRLQRIPMVVMKGVMDFADPAKADNFKAFAARASAECLIAFLRANLSSAGPGFDDILLPGTSPRREKPSPAGLLNARYHYVPFYEPGRAELIKELRGWLDGDERVRARLIHGDGGMGKTRLFIELCERLRREGWAAGFLVNDPARERFDALLGSWRRALVVIDYAESRPGFRGLLEKIAARRGDQGEGRLRVVLLARGIGDWWEDLRRSDGLVSDLLGEGEPMGLAPLAAGVEERIAVFREAAKSFADVRGQEAPERVPVLEDPRFERVLYMHMAALAAVDGLPVAADGLLEETLDHEERFWVAEGQPGLTSDRAQRLFKGKTRRAVGAFTLLGGASTQAEGRGALERIEVAWEEGLLLLLHDLYPGRQTQGYVGGLEPDLLGEGMVRRALREEEKEREEGAKQFLNHVFEGVSKAGIRTGFEVLGRMSADHAEEARRWIKYVLGRDVVGRAVLAFEATKTVGKRTAHAVLGMELSAALEREGTGELAARLEAAGLPEHTVSLREVAVWVTSAQLRRLSTGEEVPVLAERARLLNNLGNWQSELGQREAALASLLEAVEIRRKLAAGRPDAFLPALATSLNNLGGRQSEVGQLEAALASTLEAVEQSRKLVAARPDAFLPYLAMSLNNLGGRQSEVGQLEAALASTLEAVEIRRMLAAARPDVFLADLAMSLDSLGNRQSGMGQREAALASTFEAVEIGRKLAAARPDAFLPYLAGGLNNLGMRQSEVGQLEAALAPTLEAVEQYRKLAAMRPDAFLSYLAMSLNNLGNRQDEVGQREAAFASSLEAVEQYRKLAAARPDAFLPDLAGSLSNLGMRQRGVGQLEAALASTFEAVEIGRKLAAARPDSFLPYLATSLNNLGNRQNEVGQLEAALASSLEAVEIRRKLAAARPDAFLPDLAGSLNNLGMRQREVGQREAALASTFEAMEIGRKLAAARPDAFLPDLAGILNNLGVMQSELGQREAALASTLEAVEVGRKLVVARPDAFLPDLAMSLNSLGATQSELGQREAALASAEEAVEIRRKLAAGQPHVFLPDLAMSLHNLGAMQSELGQREAALASVEEAVNAIWPMFLAIPQAFARNTAMMLQHLLKRHEELGQQPSPELRRRIDAFNAALKNNSQAREGGGAVPG